MIFLLANTIFLILSVGYCWLAGDRLDKQAAAWILAAILGTLAATTVVPGPAAGLAVLLIDLVLLAAIARIALRSRRYWPTWFAGMHLVAVLAGAAALAAPLEHVQALRTFGGFWGVPALLAMVFGLFLDRRTGARAEFQAQAST